MASECDSVSTKYFGDGVTRRFSFSFTYMDPDDVVAFTYNYKRREWVDRTGQFIFITPTVIEFSFAQPAPLDNNPNIVISRRTDLDQMLKSFYPGSAIRAQDLNDNFDQLRLAIQEGRCSLEDAINRVFNETWNKNFTYTEDDQINQRWVEADDEFLASSDAIRARHDAYVQPNQPQRVVYEQTGKTWQNTEDCWSSYWQNSVDPNGNDSKTWVAYVNTGPRGEQGPQGPPGQSIVGPPGAEGPEGPPGQDGADGGTFPDAPADGTLYGRKDNDWEEVVNLPDAPADGTLYGRKDNGWEEVATVAQATYTFVAPLKEVNHVVTLDLLTIPNA